MWLKNNPKIDPQRIAIIGASYRAEYMAISARNTEYAKAYVAYPLVLFLMFQFIKDQSNTAEIMVIPSKSHAADLFEHDKSLFSDIYQNVK